MKNPVVTNSPEQPERKVNTVKGSFYFVIKINLTRKFTKDPQNGHA